jgi:hypothetical protein
VARIKSQKGFEKISVDVM